MPTDFQFDFQDTQAGDRLRYAQELAEKTKPGFLPTLFAGMEQASLTTDIINRNLGPKFTPDPSFRLTPERVKQLSDQYGVGTEYLGDLSHATSDAQAEKIVADSKHELDNKALLANAGWGGTAAQMFASVADPISLASMFTPAGVAGWAERGGALKAAIKAGLIGGGTNAAIQAGLTGMQHTSDPNDVFMAGLSGFALTAPLGGLVGHMAQRAGNLAKAHLLQTAAENGTLTEAGRAHLDASLNPETNGISPVQPEPVSTIGGQAPAVDTPAVAPAAAPEAAPQVAPAASPVEPQAGFQGGSIGSAQIGDIPQAKAAFISFKVPFTKIELPFPRFDPFAKFERAGEHWSGFMRKWVDNQVGNETIMGANGEKIFPATEVNAHEWAMLETKRYETAADQALHDSFTKFSERNGFNWMQRMQEERGFHEDVTNALRGDAETIARNPEAAQAAQHISKQNADILERMKKLGVEGADAIDPNAHYVMRKFNFDNIRLLNGDPEYRAAMHQLVTEAIQRAQPSLEATRAQAIAKNFVKRVREIPTDRKALGFLSDAGRDRFAAALRQGKVFSDEEIDDILSFVYGATKKAEDAGSAPRLKNRMFLDETHSVRFTDKEGVERTLAFKDLLVNDMRMLNRDYVRQTTGLMGFAKAGYRNKQDILDAIENAVQIDRDSGKVTDAKINQRRDAAERIVRAINGQPMYEGFGSKTEKILRSIKNFNFVNYMSQGLMAQVPELGQPLAMKTIMAMRQTMPEVEHVLRQVQAGSAPKDLLRDLKAMGAVASEADLRRPIPGLAHGDSIDQRLTKVDNFMQKAAYASSRASGMSAINDFERSTVSKLFTQRLLNLAAGFEKWDNSIAKRLATNGIEADEWESVAKAIRDHMEVDGREVKSIDMEGWERSSPRTYDLVRLAIHRETYRAIQEVSLGSTPMWMNSSVGKIIGQFRSFVMNAYTKQLLHGLNHFDAQTFLTWSFTTLFGGLAYAAQTAINYGHDPVEMNKRLAGDQIALAAFNKAGFSSILPMVWDSTAGFLTGQKAFSNARSTGLGSDLVNGNPTMATLNKIWGASSGVAQSAFTTDHVWTKREVGQSLGLLPNYYGIRSAISQFKDQFPSQNYLRPAQH